MVQSFINIGLGSLLGVFLGCGAAFAAAQVKGLHMLFMGIVSALKLIPGVCIVLLLILLSRSNNVTFLFCAVVAFVGIYETAHGALDSKDNGLVEMAQVFRMPADNTFKYIYWPKLKKAIGRASSQGVSTCMAWGITAEVVGQAEGSLGGSIYQAFIDRDMAGMMTGILIVVLATAAIKLVIFLIGKFTANQIQK